MKKIFAVIFPVVFIIFIIVSGCSASSGTLRYNKEKEPESNVSSSVRFSSAKDEQSFITEIDTSSSAYELLPDEDEPDDMPEDEPAIDLTKVMNRLNSSESNTDLSADKSTLQEKILMEIIKYLNTPYKYGGTTKDGIDCSAFTQAIYNNTLDVILLRTARDQFTMGTVIKDREDLQFGDLVFFNTRRRVRPGHVGIYIGDNLFAHSSSKHGVIVSSLDHEYYSKRYMGGRRIEGPVGARL